MFLHFILCEPLLFLVDQLSYFVWYFLFCNSYMYTRPRRNPNFTGRDVQLDTLRSKLLNQDKGKQRVVVRVEVAGMGGVGKTQLVTEYCYRNFPSQYGLVIWLNAETADTLVADYRSLLSDMAVDVVGDAVVAEMTCSSQ